MTIKEQDQSTENDLDLIKSILQGHDSVILQTIAALNATQSVLVKAGIVSKEDLMEATKIEMQEINENLVKQIKDAKEQAEST